MAWYELVDPEGKFADFYTDPRGSDLISMTIADEVTGQSVAEKVYQWAADFDLSRGGSITSSQDFRPPVTGVGGVVKSLAIDSDVAPSVFDWVPLDVAPWDNA